MDFSSLPIYLDPPNWNQHQPTNQVVIGGGAGEAQQLLRGAPAAAPARRVEEAGMAAVSSRPSSMAERARLAKIPQPEPALNCPRCDSTNTKFCYFNNYSLSQPRHFCKACRRYWTRGGSLRSVPVGGGCRRNKRSKGGNSSSKSSATSTTTSADRQSAACSSSSLASCGSLLPPNTFQPSQFMASLHPLMDYGAAGMNFSRLEPIETADYQSGSSSSGGLDQWRIQQIQQFPFLGGFDHQSSPPAATGLFPFDADVVGGTGTNGFSSQVLPKVSSSGIITQLASVKMEDNLQRLTLPRQYLGIPGNDQYWGGGVQGTDSGSGSSGRWAAGAANVLSGFNSSSSGNLL